MDNPCVQFEFTSIFESPIVCEGAPFYDDACRRIRVDRATALKLAHSDSTGNQCRQTAGVCVRFRTDSHTIAIRATVHEYYGFFNRKMACGFDVYARTNGQYCLLPGFDMEKEMPVWQGQFNIEPFVPLDADGAVEIIIYLPAYCAFSNVEIGVLPGALLACPPKRKGPKPIAFYGSSLTQSGGVARSGMIYPSIVGRMLDTEIIDMGFGGNCLGEIPIAELAATLDLAAFVLEYDHNAPNPKFLADTHEKFFRKLRELCPNLPVIMISKPDFKFNVMDDRERRAIVAQTWLNAWNNGDRCVEFIDGESIFSGLDRTNCTTDSCHYNEYGAMAIARVISERLKHYL